MKKFDKKIEQTKEKSEKSEKLWEKSREKIDKKSIDLPLWFYFSEMSECYGVTLPKTEK